MKVKGVQTIWSKDMNAKAIDDPYEWFFTFGFGHYCAEYGHLARCYVRVSGDFTAARQKVVDILGPKWGMQYPIDELEEQVERYGLKEVDLYKIVAVQREGVERHGTG